MKATSWKHTHMQKDINLLVDLFILKYIYISDKMIKISGKVDKPNTSNGFSSDISFFIQELLKFEKVLSRIKNEILLLNLLKVFGLSTFPLIFIIYMVVSVNGLGDRVQFQVLSCQRLKKMVLDVALLNTQHCKVWIKGKVCNPRKGIAPSTTPLCRAFGSPSTTVANFVYLLLYSLHNGLALLHKYTSTECTNQCDTYEVNG